MMGEAKDTRDTKIAWLVFLENVDISLSRLRKDASTLCHSETKESSKSAIDLMSTAERAIERLGLKLMDTWGIKRNMLLKWMDLGAYEYAKHTAFQGFIVSRSNNLQSGLTKKSRKK